MIILNLACAGEHRFEGWFASSAAFETQQQQEAVRCPICGSHEIKRLPSAPHLARPAPTAMPAAQGSTPAQQIMAALQSQAARSEDVGERFAEEARRIHYGDAEERDIRGVASVAEARDLLAEGISVLPVPAKKADLH